MGDNALTRHYLRFLLDEVVVTDNHVQIIAKSEAALRMLAATGKSVPAGEVAHQDGVLTSVVPWLPEPAVSRTWSVSAIYLEPQRSPPAMRQIASPPERAGDTYRALLAAEPNLSRADLARRLGVSRAAVTQALRGRRSRPRSRAS